MTELQKLITSTLKFVLHVHQKSLTTVVIPRDADSCLLIVRRNAKAAIKYRPELNVFAHDLMRAVETIKIRDRLKVSHTVVSGPPHSAFTHARSWLDNS